MLLLPVWLIPIVAAACGIGFGLVKRYKRGWYDRIIRLHNYVRGPLKDIWRVVEVLGEMNGWTGPRKAKEFHQRAKEYLDDYRIPEAHKVLKMAEGWIAEWSATADSDPELTAMRAKYKAKRANLRKLRG